jgi:hypothetical protein
MARLRQGCIVIPHHGLSKGDQELAVLDTTTGCRLVVSQGCQVHLDTMMRAARTEQIRVGTGSIKTLTQRRYATGNQLYLHAVQRSG